MSNNYKKILLNEHIYRLLAISVFTFVMFLNSDKVYAGTGINAQIPYSGNIIKNDGTVLNGNYKAKFILYNAQEGGDVVYEEVRDGVTQYSGIASPTVNFVDGRFEVMLGSQNTSLKDINNESLWLELQLDVDTTNPDYEEKFLPRKRIGSAASAINAMRLVAANGGADTDTLSLDVSGNVVATSLGGTANASTPIGGFDRLILANASGQLSQVSLDSLGSGPGGSENQIQYKSGSVFAGASNVEISQGALLLKPQSTPSNPASGSILYTERVAGRDLPFYMSESGRPKPIAQAWYDSPSPVIVSVSSTNNAPTVFGGTVVSAAQTTSYQHTASSTNRYLSLPRKRYSTGNTNSTVGVRQDYTYLFSGSAEGYGGVFFAARFGMSVNKTSNVFVGLTASTVALSGTSSALVNMIGMGYDLADASTGNWFLMRNDGTGTATKVDLGATEASRAADKGFELNIYNPPNSTTWYVYIVSINTGNVVLNTSYNTDVPAVNTGLTWKLEARNDSTATALGIEHNYIYIEPQGW